MPSKKSDAQIEEAAVDEADEAAEEEQPTKRLDETVPGGRYVVDGVTVDANGQPVKD